MSPTIDAMPDRNIPPEALIDHATKLARDLDELWVAEDLPFAGCISQMATILEATRGSSVVLGVAGPPPLEPSGEVADGTVPCEANGPDEIAVALKHIDTGRYLAERRCALWVGSRVTLGILN